MRLRLTNAADWKRLVAYVKELPFMRDGKGVGYLVSIEEMKSKRTLDQNAYMWALLTAISQQAPAHMGGVYYSPHVWHKYCASRFLGVEPGPWGHGVPKSTANLKVGEFCDYLAQIEAWAVDEFAGWSFEYEAAA